MLDLADDEAGAIGLHYMASKEVNSTMYNFAVKANAVQAAMSSNVTSV